MPTKYADLEVALRRRDAGNYSVELRFNAPDDDAEIRLIKDGAGAVTLDLPGLRALELDAKSYGASLSAAVFRAPSVASAFAQARSTAQSQDSTLRVRLFLEPSASELQGLRWETVFTGEQVIFSRYLSSQDWRPVKLRPEARLSALVVVSNPANLSQYAPGGQLLAPIDVAGELSRAEQALAGITISPMGDVTSLNNIIARLRDGFDILYLVCHGALIDGEPRLWLEGEAGRAAVTSGSELVERLNDLIQRPRLVVLASCQSSGSLTALGPQLAEAGIPAVVSMQGDVSMETVARFMPVFFKELLRDGQIDRAMSVARDTVRDRPDYWMPVLFMRLRRGRIWYVPGFADDPKGFEKWPAIQSSIQQGRCTPILGSGLVEGLFGSTRENARRWSEQYHFPMAPHNREDLPNVAQFLAVNQDPQFPRDALIEYLGQELVRRHAGDLSEELRDASLDQKMKAISAKARRRNPAEPYRLLAGKPFPILITTNPDDLLEEALR
jgi:CHAT domain